MFSSILLYLALYTINGAKFAVADVSSHYRQPSWCKEPHRRSPPSPNVVALASSPGSGNTWLRYLLQQVTGIATGSNFMDQNLRVHGFSAENVSDGSVLVVKTHLPPQNKFTSAILLIRNPRGAILAEFNRIHRGHIGTVPKRFFNRTNYDKVPEYMKNLFGIWPNHVPETLNKWELFNRQWLSQFTGPLHIVLYEELVRDTRVTLYGILGFLNQTVTEFSDFRISDVGVKGFIGSEGADMTCALVNREGIYRRWKKYEDFDPFTPDMYRMLENGRERVAKAVADYQRGLNNTVGQSPEIR